MKGELINETIPQGFRVASSFRTSSALCGKARRYRQACNWSLFLPLVLLVFAPSVSAQPAASRGEQLLSIDYQECMRRAPLALQAEGFSAIRQASNLYLGFKEIHVAYIMCNAAPDIKMWVNIVVASNARDGGVPGYQRQRLQAQMARVTPGKGPSYPNLHGNWESKFRPDSPWVGTSIRQDGLSLTFYNEHGGKSKGLFRNRNEEVEAIEWSNGLRARITDGGNRLEWANGTVWRRRQQTRMARVTPGKGPNLQGNWESKMRPDSPWAGTSIIQEGNSLTFYNERGGKSKGRFISASEVVADEWQNGLRARITDGGNRLEWANGSVWRRRQ